MKYKLKFADLDTTIELTTKQLEALSGNFQGTLGTLLSVEKIPKLRCWLKDYQNYYYIPNLGLCHNSRWREFLPPEFLQHKKTVTQICVEFNVPRSLARCLNYDNSFKEFVNTESYKHLLGKLNHSKHTNFGAIANMKKTDRVRFCDRKDVSWKRVEPLLKEYDLTLLEEWEGTRNKDNSVKFYKVKCNRCGEEYETYLHARDVRVCPRCKVGKYSAVRESIIKDYLESKGLKVLQNYRLLIKSPKNIPMEVDLFIPDKNVAFEFNGYRWHSSFYKDKNYHKYKTEECLKKGIKLYHIWSDTSDDLCKSIVCAKLGLLKRIYARKCVIGESSTDFFNNNHIDGNCRALKRWSLYFQGEEVCQLSVRKHKEGLEIARFASKIGIEVVGGYSKLLKLCIEWAKQKGFERIITYCNRDISPDPKNNFYANSKFTFVNECSLILKYANFAPVELNGVLYKSNSIISRQRCQKHIILKSLGLKSSNLSESKLAEKLGLYQVYNSGNFKYKIEL